MNKHDGPFSWRRGLYLVLVLAAAPLIGYLLGDADRREKTAGDILPDGLQLAVGFAIILLLAPVVWRLFRRYIVDAATHARAHRDPASEEYGRVFPAGPTPEEHAQRAAELASDDPGWTEPPSAAARWWFHLEGWQQTSVIGATIAIVVITGLHLRFNNDGIQLSDVFGAVYIFSFILWFTLTFWARAYAARRYPQAVAFTDDRSRNLPIGIIGVFGAAEMFLPAIWFLATSVWRAATVPGRHLTRSGR